ncbi:unnamed protein product [Schistocephalus solidus]|uniref:Endo/exonuclease/phosphatase domain-containing protein n=1 Tax=Schistocephalus solidus TaxID=70667 RepID=A0A183T0J4_SCHSO|nr:unnamed protein product [Schistocephalus solidus]
MREKVAWMPPSSRRWHLLDYVLVWKRELQDILLTKASPSADGWTDHRLVLSNMRLCQQPRRRPLGKQPPALKAGIEYLSLGACCIAGFGHWSDVWRLFRGSFGLIIRAEPVSLSGGAGQEVFYSAAQVCISSSSRIYVVVVVVKQDICLGDGEEEKEVTKTRVCIIKPDERDNDGLYVLARVRVGRAYHVVEGAWAPDALSTAPQPSSPPSTKLSPQRIINQRHDARSQRGSSGNRIF